MVNKIMIFEETTGFYDLYIFNESYDLEDLRKSIKDYKQNNRDWNLETIEIFIKKNYSVKEVISCDYVFSIDEI